MSCTIKLALHNCLYSHNSGYKVNELINKEKDYTIDCKIHRIINVKIIIMNYTHVCATSLIHIYPPYDQRGGDLLLGDTVS